MTDEDERLADRLARRLREFRQARGVRQSEIADQFSSLGFAWVQSTVAAVEAGRRQLTNAELVVLPSVLGVLAGTRISVGALLGDAPLLLSDALRVAGREVEQLLAGHGVPDATAASASVAPTPRPDLGPENVPVGPFTQLDRTVSKALGVRPEVTHLLAVNEYGRRLSEERDWRVALQAESEQGMRGEALTPRQLQALRGHATRRLIWELKHRVTDEMRRWHPDGDET